MKVFTTFQLGVGLLLVVPQVANSGDVEVPLLPAASPSYDWKAAVLP